MENRVRFLLNPPKLRRKRHALDYRRCMHCGGDIFVEKGVIFKSYFCERCGKGLKNPHGQIILVTD